MDLLASGIWFLVPILPSPSPSPPSPQPSSPSASATPPLSKQIYGLPVPKAKEKLRLINPKVQTKVVPYVSRPPATDANTDAVYATDPPLRGSRVPDNIVLYTIGCIPDLTGLTRQAATSTLIKHGMRAELKPSDAPASWLVQSQKPGPTSPFRWGSRVAAFLVAPPVNPTPTRTNDVHPATSGPASTVTTTPPASTSVPAVGPSPLRPLPTRQSGAIESLAVISATIVLLLALTTIPATRRHGRQWVRTNMRLRVQAAQKGRTTVWPPEGGGTSVHIRAATGSAGYTIKEVR